MRLTYEDGHIVLRKPDGTLGWSIHSLDVESNNDHVEPNREVDFKGTIEMVTPSGKKTIIQID